MSILFSRVVSSVEYDCFNTIYSKTAKYDIMPIHNKICRRMVVCLKAQADFQLKDYLYLEQELHTVPASKVKYHLHLLIKIFAVLLSGLRFRDQVGSSPLGIQS